MRTGASTAARFGLVPSSFRAELRQSLAERVVGPGVSAPTVAGFVGVIALVIATSILGTSDAPHYHFVNERGAITAVSSILLSMSAAFGLAAALLSGDRDLRTRVFWFGVCFGMALLAVDELMELHEKIGGKLDAAEATAGVTAAGWRGWNDVLVMLYGVAAIPVGLCFLPTILRYPRMLEFLAVAFAFFVVHTVVDSVTEPPTVASAIVEESAKLYCGAFLALAFLSALLCIARRGRA